jgi:hypothetical protein
MFFSQHIISLLTSPQNGYKMRPAVLAHQEQAESKERRPLLAGAF